VSSDPKRFQIKRLTKDFFAGLCTPQESEKNLFKVLKGKDFLPRILHLGKISFET
jgi:hypothetical protein